MRYIISSILASAAISATTPAAAEVPRVVTDLPPVHALVSQVMGDLGEPQLLLEKGANAHSFQMRPSQAAGLQEAGLVVWIGPEMTPWLDRALDGLTGAHQLRLLTAAGTYRQDFAAKPHDHAAHETPSPKDAPPRTRMPRTATTRPQPRRAMTRRAMKVMRTAEPTPTSGLTLPMPAIGWA